MNIFSNKLSTPSKFLECSYCFARLRCNSSPYIVFTYQIFLIRVNRVINYNVSDIGDSHLQVEDIQNTYQTAEYLAFLDCSLKYSLQGLLRTIFVFHVEVSCPYIVLLLDKKVNKDHRSATTQIPLYYSVHSRRTERIFKWSEMTQFSELCVAKILFISWADDTCPNVHPNTNRVAFITRIHVHPLRGS